VNYLDPIEEGEKKNPTGNKRDAMRVGSGPDVTGIAYLDGLSVLLEDVHAHHRLVELRVQGLDDLIVQVLLRTADEQEECCVKVVMRAFIKMYLKRANWIKGCWRRVPCLILESVESLKDELKEGVQVVRARRGDENVRVAVEEEQNIVRHSGTHEKFYNQICRSVVTTGLAGQIYS